MIHNAIVSGKICGGKVVAKKTYPFGLMNIEIEESGVEITIYRCEHCGPVKKEEVQDE